MRYITKESDIPYLSDDIRYYEQTNNELRELNQNVDLLRDAYLRAKAGESKIYFTWHGQYKTDMFYLDDLSRFALAFGFESDHTHEITWQIQDPNERGAYVTADVEFKCGCTFNGADGKKRLQMTLKSLKGWTVSGSYLGYHNGKYTVRILKSSIL